MCTSNRTHVSGAMKRMLKKLIKKSMYKESYMHFRSHLGWNRIKTPISRFEQGDRAGQENTPLTRISSEGGVTGGWESRVEMGLTQVVLVTWQRFGGVGDRLGHKQGSRGVVSCCKGALIKTTHLGPK